MKVAIDKITGCHIFQGCKTKGGYGRVRVKGVHWMAHRYALSVHLRRPLDEGCVVMHSCDNPSCVNPEHLSEGTQVESMKDCKEKGRLYRPGPKSPARGDRSKNHLMKIKLRQAETIRKVLAHGGKPRVVAKELGLNYSWVLKVFSGEISIQ